MAVAIAIASSFDASVGKQTDASVTELVAKMNSEQENLFGASAPPVNTTEKKTRAARESDAGLDAESVDTWKRLTKIDAFYSKLTGKLSPAPWSGVNSGTRDMPLDALKSKADETTGKQIMQRITEGAEREARSGRMAPGRRK